MVDRDGDGQVCFEEFFKMITGKKPPAQLGGGGKYGARSSKIQRNPNLSHQENLNEKSRHSNMSAQSSYIDTQNSLSQTSISQPLTGQAVIQARNTKRKSLHEFTKDHNLKPESIKRAHRRFLAVDKKKSGVIDYTEFCEVLQVDPSPQCEDLFRLYDYKKSGLIDAKELLIAITNFTGAGKDDK